MSSTKKKGYRVEWKIMKIFESNNWYVVRAGGSLGEADIVGLKNGKCILFQIKSTKKKILYYYGYDSPKLSGFPFYLIVDFGYGKIKVTKPKKIIRESDGVMLKDFLSRYNK